MKPIYFNGSIAALLRRYWLSSVGDIVRATALCVIGLGSACVDGNDMAWVLMPLALAYVIRLTQRAGSWHIAALHCWAFWFGWYAYRWQQETGQFAVEPIGLAIVVALVMTAVSRSGRSIALRWLLGAPLLAALLDVCLQYAPAPWSSLPIAYTQSAYSPFAAFAVIGGVFGVSLLMWCCAGAVFLIINGHRSLRSRAWCGLAVVALAGYLLTQQTFTSPTGAPTRIALAQFNARQPLDAALQRDLKLAQQTDAQLLIVAHRLSAVEPTSIDDAIQRTFGSSAPTTGAELIVQISGPSDQALIHRDRLARLPMQRRDIGFSSSARPLSINDETPQQWLLAGQHVALCCDHAFNDRSRVQRASSAWLLSGEASSLQSTISQRRIAQLQAIAFAKPAVIFSAQNGSMLIDPHGRIVDALEANETALLTVKLQGRAGVTPYALIGDMPLIALSIVVMALALWAQRKGRHHSLKPNPSWQLRRGQFTATSSNHRHSRFITGQALPLGMFFILAAAAVLYLMVNSGQLVKEKLRVTNAADAAAYSAGVVQARALNFIAYTNRAIIANQVSIAQAVSLISWIQYYRQAIKDAVQIGTATASFGLPLLVKSSDSEKALVYAAALTGSAVANYYTGGTVETILSYVANTLSPTLGLQNTATQSLAEAQQIVLANLAVGIQQASIAEQIAKQTDPAMTAEVVIPSYTFDDLTYRYGDADRSRLAEATMASLDPFSRDRSWTIEGQDKYISIIQKNVVLRKVGGTGLSTDFTQWRAVDTLELHGQQLRCTGFLGVPKFCDDVQRPLSWGAADASASETDAGQGQIYLPAYQQNANTAALADSTLRRMSGLYSGLPATHDVKNLTPESDKKNVAAITILVSKPKSALQTSSNAMRAKPAGRLNLYQGNEAGGKVASLARAEVFYERPTAQGIAKELANLYEPYWQVRLVPALDLDYQWAATKQNLLSLGN